MQRIFSAFLFFGLVWLIYTNLYCNKCHNEIWYESKNKNVYEEMMRIMELELKSIAKEGQIRDIKQKWFDNL